MRIHLISDIHTEGRAYKGTIPDCDLVILSGDIARGKNSVLWAKEHCKAPVVLIPGNHEYYRGTLSIVRMEMQEAAKGSEVFVLDNKVAIIDGIAFIGSTLWTDYELFGDQGAAMFQAGQWMNDHRLILKYPDYQPFFPADALNEHIVAREFIEYSLSTWCGKNPVVVCTHHAPSFLSVNEKYKTDGLTPAFASNLDWLMEKYTPALWTHGHMHDACDYVINKTRVVCNPLGYPSEIGRNGFREDLVIEV